MLNKKIEKAINKQINAEIWSAYLYLSMSAYLEDKGLPGFANWMKNQWKEELAHAMKFFDYVNERSGRVVLEPIAKVPKEWKSPIHIMEETLKHEREVTSLINNLTDLAIKEKDHATNNLLQWFIAEQVEEEATVGDILNKLKMIEGKGHAMLMIDKELGSRVFVEETV
jgi:ferritin